MRIRGTLAAIFRNSEMINLIESPKASPKADFPETSKSSNTSKSLFLSFVKSIILFGLFEKFTIANALEES